MLFTIKRNNLLIVSRRYEHKCNWQSSLNLDAVVPDHPVLEQRKNHEEQIASGFVIWIKPSGTGGAGREVWTSITKNVWCLIAGSFPLPPPLAPHLGKLIKKKKKACPFLGAYMDFKHASPGPPCNHDKNQGHLLPFSQVTQTTSSQPALPRRSHSEHTAVFSHSLRSCVASSVLASDLSVGVGSVPPLQRDTTARL